MSIKIPIFLQRLPAQPTLVYDIGIPATLLLIGTLIFRLTDLDLALQKPFFVENDGWVSQDIGLWKFLYDYGPTPAIAIAVTLLFIFIASFWARRIAAYRKVALYGVLVMLLGPGLVVNGIFKDLWGRPRPRNVQEFGGDQTYLKVWQKGVSGQGRSFPSGHASVGYFLMTPFFVLRKRAHRWAVAFLALGIGSGLLIGLARMIQGGHFASDVLWAGGFVYFTAFGIWHALGGPGIKHPDG